LPELRRWFLWILGAWSPEGAGSAFCAARKVTLRNDVQSTNEYQERRRDGSTLGRRTKEVEKERRKAKEKERGSLAKAKVEVHAFAVESQDTLQ